MVLAGTGLRAQGTQLDMEVPKTLALMSRVADVGLETVDIAMGRKKMKAAAVMRTAVRETAVDLRTAAVNTIIKNYCKIKMAEIRNTTAAVRANKRQGSIMTFLKRFSN